MQITIRRFTAEVKEGMFKSKVVYRVHLFIRFSDEERNIIQTVGIEDYEVYGEDEHMKDGTPFRSSVKLGEILVPKGEFTGLKSFPTPGQANYWENDLRENVLPTLKSFIMANKPVPDSIDTFEL